MMQEITESDIVCYVSTFLINKENGNWHEDKAKVAKLHQHGADIVLIGGKRNSEYFIIECKGKPKSKDTHAGNEIFLNALGQLITRMNTKRVIESGKRKGDVNRAYKYGLGLYWKTAQVALRRIPKEIAKTLNLYIFAVNDDGKVIQFPPSKVGKTYSDEYFGWF